MINWYTERAIQVLHDNGFTKAQIAEILDISINTVKKYLTKK